MQRIFERFFFYVLTLAFSVIVGKFLMILLVIWRERNEKYWKISVVSSSRTTFGAMKVLCD